MLLRSRIVLPISHPAIEDGAVCLAGDRIVSVGRWADLRATGGGEVIDLGETVLLPGFINAHCHLDYTDMAGQIPPPRSFSDWIKAIVAFKAEWSYTEFAQSWLHGAVMLLRTGATTVLDVEAVPELIPEMWKETPLRVISFREMIALKRRPDMAGWVDLAAREWAELPGGRERGGLSPHAPYSTTSDLLQCAAKAARQRNLPLTTHVAESQEEFDMFVHRRGPLYSWLQSQRDMSDCGQVSPVQHLERCGYLSENMLAAHANYMGSDDIALLARRKVSIVHCPRSHAYFGHRAFPFSEAAAAGINLCLGTDSLVTVFKPGKELPQLNLFAEMQVLAANNPTVAPAAIVRVA